MLKLGLGRLGNMRDYHESKGSPVITERHKYYNGGYSYSEFNPAIDTIIDAKRADAVFNILNGDKVYDAGGAYRP